MSFERYLAERILINEVAPLVAAGTRIVASGVRNQAVRNITTAASNNFRSKYGHGNQYGQRTQTSTVQSSQNTTQPNSYTHSHNTQNNHTVNNYYSHNPNTTNGNNVVGSSPDGSKPGDNKTDDKSTTGTGTLEKTVKAIDKFNSETKTYKDSFKKAAAGFGTMVAAGGKGISQVGWKGIKGTGGVLKNTGNTLIKHLS